MIPGELNRWWSSSGAEAESVISLHCTALSACLDITVPEGGTPPRQKAFAGWDVTETARTRRVSGQTVQSKEGDPDKVKNILLGPVWLAYLEGQYPEIFKAQRLEAWFWFSPEFLYVRDTLTHSAVLTMCSWRVVATHLALHTLRLKQRVGCRWGTFSIANQV